MEHHVIHEGISAGPVRGIEEIRRNAASLRRARPRAEVQVKIWYVKKSDVT